MRLRAAIEPRSSRDRAAIEPRSSRDRAAIEPRSSDVTKLVPLDHGSRDVRATVVRALGSLCSNATLGPLNAHSPDQRSLQVKYAITAAVQALGQCGN